jgi:hypothetical protein
MTIEEFWKQISVAIEYCNTCDICPVKIFANETGTEFICCDMNCDCADGLKMLHKKLQEEEREKQDSLNELPW